MNTASARAMALADGQLAPAEVPGLVQELAQNPALVAELQMYLAVSRQRIAEPYGAKAEETVPPRLVGAVLRGAPPDGRLAAPSSLVRNLMERLKGRYSVPAWSLAAAPASAAVLVAVAVWLAMLSQGSLVAASLGTALERTNSGKDAALVAVRPVLSFWSKDATWCRQYEVRYASKQISHGLACRTNEGQWNVIASTGLGPIGLAPAASGPRSAIDHRATAMMDAQPLSNADEAAAIGKGWPRL